MAEEKNFENRVKKFLRSKGIYPLGVAKQEIAAPPVGYYEKRWGNAMTTPGLPDMHIVVKGTSIEVELKAPRGKPSVMQVHIMEQIRATGSTGFIMYEDKKIENNLYCTFEEFKKLICKMI